MRSQGAHFIDHRLIAMLATKTIAATWSSGTGRRRICDVMDTRSGVVAVALEISRCGRCLRRDRGCGLCRTTTFLLLDGVVGQVNVLVLQLRQIEGEGQTASSSIHRIVDVGTKRIDTGHHHPHTQIELPLLLLLLLLVVRRR